jgi:hypothetical protein
MKIVSVENLALEGRMDELRRHVTHVCPLIEDYIEVGAYFSDAAKNLGFKCDTSSSKVNIRLILNPDEYKCIEKLPEFTQVILNNIRQRRDDIIKMVNDELVFNSYKLTHTNPDVSSSNYHMLDISKIILSTISSDYLRYVNISVDADKVQTDFKWLIRELEDTGYHARFVTPQTGLCIQVSISRENLIKK